MKCPKCGRDINQEGQIYCLYCGASLSKNKKGKKKKVVLPVGIACGCAAVLAAGFFLAAQETQAGKLEKKLAEGNKYLASAEYEKAEVAFSEALAIDETSPDAAIGMAKVSNEKDEPEKALEYLTKASDNLAQKPVADIKKDKNDWKEKSSEYQEVFNTTIQLLSVSSNTEVVQQAVQVQEQIENTFAIIGEVAEDDTIEYDDDDRVMDLEEYETEVLQVTGDGDSEETTSADPETESALETASVEPLLVIYDDEDPLGNSAARVEVETTEQTAEEEEMTEETTEETTDQTASEVSVEVTSEAEGESETEPVTQQTVEADLPSTTEAIMEVLSESGTAVQADAAVDSENVSPETTAPENANAETEVQTEAASETATGLPAETESQSETEAQTETEALAEALSPDELLDNYAAQIILPAAPYLNGTEISYDYAAGSGSLASVSGTLGLEKVDLDGDGIPELAVISAAQGKLNVNVYRVVEQSVEAAGSATAVCSGLGSAVEGLSYTTVQECFIRDNGGSFDIGFASHCCNINRGDGNPAVQTSVELYRYADGALSLINAATIRNGMSVFTGGNEGTAVDGGKEEFMAQLSAMGLSGSWITESADTCVSMDLVNNPWQDLSAVSNPLSGGLSAGETGIQDLAVLTGTMGAEGQTISFSVQNNTNMQN